MNDQPPHDPMRVLVVCVGNLCRSPLAERLLQLRLDGSSPDAAVVTSAGTSAPDGRDMDVDAAAQLIRLGGDPTGFASRRLTSQILADQHLVLTATKDLRQQVISLAPRLMKRTFSLTEFAAIVDSGDLADVERSRLPVAAASHRSAGAAAPDIADPIGLGEVAHRQAADQIATAVTAVAGVLGR